MNPRKRKMIMIPVLLLLLLLLGLIAWLTHIMLTLQAPPPVPLTATIQKPHSERQKTYPGPIDSVFIEIYDAPELATDIEAADTPPVIQTIKPPPTATSAICDTFGVEIREKDSFLNPLSISTVVTPTRVHINFNIQPERP